MCFNQCMSRTNTFPENLISLHQEEENIRQKSLDEIHTDPKLTLHINTIENAMNLLEAFRQLPIDDEDIKVIQVLGIRMFNALSSAMKLVCSGYYQNSALILRDILETVFLIDLFETDRTAIKRWRTADKKARQKEFKPVKVRESLDRRDGFTNKKRAEMYNLFSELAAHPSMAGIEMLRPKDKDIHVGPFFDKTALKATLDEMGRLAVQVGGSIDEFFPENEARFKVVRTHFAKIRMLWFQTFYPKMMERISKAKDKE